MKISASSICYSFSVLLLLGMLACNENSTTSEREEDEPGYDHPEGYNEFYRLITTPMGQQSNNYPVNYQLKALQKAKEAGSYHKSARSNWNWVQRGPGNVAGRTRDVLIDPNDPTHATWYAASASGGLWKTSNAGASWQNLTPDLLNLATNCLAMAPSQTNMLYLGTGEGYGGFGMVTGNGIFRSADSGQSWEQLTSTSNNEDFRWINKLLVSNHDANTVVCATNTGIFKTTDGGVNWNPVYHKGYAVQWLAVNPQNPNTLYAAVNRLGIIKSYNFGTDWVAAWEGIGIGYRFSVAVSPVDSNRVFTSVEASGQQTDLYISDNGALSWAKLYDYDYSFYHFLGTQGWFNNIVCAHPFDANRLFIGGVHLGTIRFLSTTSQSTRQVLRVDTVGIGGYLRFVSFGGASFNGALALGLDEGADVDEEDYVSVELRFGPSRSQRAHRFTVPVGEGGGVPEHLYSYQDYVSVPFEVWDVDHNQQLMVSFRDQDRNGAFNPEDIAWDDPISGREYVFVHSHPYAESPEPAIAQSGGHYNKMLYFLWPTLPVDSTWHAEDLPEASLSIRYGSFNLRNATTTILANDTRNSALHVDHHDLEAVVLDAGQKTFMLLDANDGGVGLSSDNGNVWKQLNTGYTTTQFYGVAKKAGTLEFIGGMQDNGTWQSPAGEEATQTSAYLDRVAGDGFEVLWHPVYPSRILATSYYNHIELSLDGGRSWTTANQGISGGGPFITRLSNSPQNPDLVFAVGNYGVYHHSNFGVGRYPWRLTEIDSGWALNNEVTSAHNVEVSLASPAVVWAGGAMHANPDLNIYVSTDYGESFEKTTVYNEQEMGYITAIATHPTDSATAYLLFSMAEHPKILRTTNLGESWQDITGFGTGKTSTNGFPDVMVYCLLVHPDETTTLWAGTEIGIFESTDNGGSWHYADIGFPAVSVWQLFVQDHTLVAATHGRGIWTTSLWPDALSQITSEALEMKLYPNPTTDGLVNLQATGLEPGELTWEVFSASGMKLFTGHAVSLSQEFHSSINLSDYAAGVYFVRVSCGGSQVVRRLVHR